MLQKFAISWEFYGKLLLSGEIERIAMGSNESDEMLLLSS